MQLELRSIFVDRNSDRVNQLVTNYRSDIRFQVTDFVNSAHKAVQSIVEEPYHVCFIDESVPAEEANVLFSDVGKIEGREKCVFIQVREEIPEEFNFEQLQQLGYDQAITRKGTHQERTGLAQLLAERFRETEVEVRKFNVGSTLKMVMDAIDTAASNRRRGYKSSVHTLPVEFVELQTSFADEILEDYFEMLSNQAEESSTAEFVDIEVPDRILSKNLPKLEKNNYVGASRRVWQKLAKLHGKSDGKARQDLMDTEAQEQVDAGDESDSVN